MSSSSKIQEVSLGASGETVSNRITATWGWCRKD